MALLVNLRLIQSSVGMIQIYAPRLLVFKQRIPPL